MYYICKAQISHTFPAVKIVKNSKNFLTVTMLKQITKLFFNGEYAMQCYVH